MNVRTIVVGRQANGSVDLRLNIDSNLVAAALKTPTQSDLNLMGLPRVRQLTGDLVLQQLAVNDAWDTGPQPINAPLLAAGTGAKPVRILAANKTEATTWTLDADLNLISAAATTGANILVLPSTHDETEATYRQRLATARRFTAKNAPGLRVTVGLAGMGSDFQSIWAFLVGAAEKLAAVNVSGYKGAMGNLADVATSVETMPEPPFVIGYNGERWVKRDSDRGAAALFLRRMGFQTLAPKVYPPFEPEGDSGPCWYDVSRGGYVDTPPAQLQGPADVEGTPGRAAAGMAIKQQLDLRRYDETWKYAAETPVVNQYVQNGAFDAYRATHDLLDASMTRLGI